jgi:2,3-bisphosphoglycerate-dependent phosphoglycerate mutase
MRHGTTDWAEHGRFAGWGDAPLSAPGEELARKAGALLKKMQMVFDVCHTSRLVRAGSTLDLVLETMGAPDVPIVRDWRLNERHYGALQEQLRTSIADHYGQEAVIAWRRSYRARPPALRDDDPRWREQCERFADLPEDAMPRTESLEDGVLRVEPYWHECLAPALRAGKRVLLVAHTCSIRGLVRILDGLSDDEAEAFRIPTALPTLYELDADLKTIQSRQLIHDATTWWRNLSSRCKPRWMYWS